MKFMHSETRMAHDVTMYIRNTGVSNPYDIHYLWLYRNEQSQHSHILNHVYIYILVFDMCRVALIGYRIKPGCIFVYQYQVSTIRKQVHDAAKNQVPS